MNPSVTAFREPTDLEKFFNRALGILIGWGLGPGHIYLVEVRGRKTGKLYTTPVNPLDFNGKRYLVAPRGRTQWVRNAEAAGQVILRRGGNRQQLRVRALPESEKPPILKSYLDHYRREVQRYFPVAAESPLEAFVAISSGYPVFELLSN